MIVLVYSKLGDYSKALIDINKSIELNPDYAMAYNNRSYIYSQLGDYFKANQDFIKAKELGFYK